MLQLQRTDFLFGKKIALSNVEFKDDHVIITVFVGILKMHLSKFYDLSYLLLWFELFQSYQVYVHLNQRVEENTHIHTDTISMLTLVKKRIQMSQAEQ